MDMSTAKGFVVGILTSVVIFAAVWLLRVGEHRDTVQVHVPVTVEVITPDGLADKQSALIKRKYGSAAEEKGEVLPKSDVEFSTVKGRVMIK